MELTAIIILIFTVGILLIWCKAKWMIVKEIVKSPTIIFNQSISYEGQNAFRFFIVPLILFFIMSISIGIIWG